jgi:hypothetical protein
MSTGPLVPRDSRKDALYWTELTARERALQQALHARLREEGRSSQHRSQWLVAAHASHQRLAIACYSQGQPLGVVRDEVTLALEALSTMIEGTPDEPFALRGRDDYFSALWLLSLGYTLGVERTQLMHVVETVGNRGKDALYEALLAAATFESYPAATVLHPRPYKLLFDAVQANPELRPRLTRGYLDRYYTQSRGAYWWGSHERGSPYVGYWCLEVAAFVRALAIPDSEFADHPFYPRDLARPTLTER